MLSRRLRFNILQALPFWIASIIAGLVTVLFAKLFVVAENTMLWIYNWHHWIIFIQAPAFMLAGWWIVKKWAPYARGSGIPQVKAATELIAHDPKKNINQLLGIKVSVVKILSTLLLAIGGAAIGREGPTIQISGSIFNYINGLIPKKWPKIKHSNMIVAGAAAGLAAAFNTPLGGIVFALEELSKTHVTFYRTALFSAVIIAGLTAQGILGPYLYLGVPSVSESTWHTLIPVLIVAIGGGLSASYLCSAILKTLRWKAKAFTKNAQHIVFIIACATVIALFAYFVNISIMGSGKDIMGTLLFSNDKVMPWYTSPFRMLGLFVSFISGGAGGVFAPGLAAGATLGGMVGNWFHLVPGDINLLVLVGMVAFLTGITRTPFTSAILVLEMTDRNSAIFFLMLAAIVAELASLVVDKKSFYDHLKHDYLLDIKRKEEELQLPQPAEPA